MALNWTHDQWFLFHRAMHNFDSLSDSDKAFFAEKNREYEAAMLEASAKSFEEIAKFAAVDATGELSRELFEAPVALRMEPPAGHFHFKASNDFMRKLQ